MSEECSFAAHRKTSIQLANNIPSGDKSEALRELHTLQSCRQILSCRLLLAYIWDWNHTFVIRDGLDLIKHFTLSRCRLTVVGEQSRVTQNQELPKFGYHQTSNELYSQEQNIYSKNGCRSMMEGTITEEIRYTKIRRRQNLNYRTELKSRDKRSCERNLKSEFNLTQPILGKLDKREKENKSQGEK